MIVLVITSLLGAGCSTDKDSRERPAATIGGLAGQTTQAYTLALPPNPELLIGPNRLVFALLDKENAFVPGKHLKLYFGRSQSDVARGPVPVKFEDDGLGDRAFYRATVDFPARGKWLVLVAEESAGKKLGAGAEVQVTNQTDVLRLGDKALSVPTPTVADHRGLADICTREPEDPMHEISLDQALTNGKPTMLVFATPKYCASRVCGPVVDQVLRVRQDYADKANFVHAEVYQTDPSGDFTEAMKAYKLKTEPWTFVIDAGGVVRGRFEGPVTTQELKDSMEQVV